MQDGASISCSCSCSAPTGADGKGHRAGYSSLLRSVEWKEWVGMLGMSQQLEPSINQVADGACKLSGSGRRVAKSPFSPSKVFLSNGAS